MTWGILFIDEHEHEHKEGTDIYVDFFNRAQGADSCTGTLVVCV